MNVRALKIKGEWGEFSVYSLQIKVGSGKSAWFSKSEKELLWTSAGCQDYDNGKLQKSINEWGKGGVRLVHFSAKVIVGHLESEEIWLKRVKEQLMEAWIINFCYPFSFGVLKQPTKSLALGDGWVGQTYWVHSLLHLKFCTKRGIFTEWVYSFPVSSGFLKTYHWTFLVG